MLLCCCSSDNEVKAEASTNTGKTLVVYYSYTGNCRDIVNMLTNQIQADVLEIQPAEKGQKYEANNYALGTQLLNAIKANPNDAGSYPAIDPVTTSLNDYRNIIIVTPLWWSQMAAIMQTYLFQNASQMADKHVVLIVSSASSGISQLMADAKRLLPNVTWMGNALWINNSNRSNTTSLVQNWLKTLSFAKEQTTMDKMYITIDGKTQCVTLADNAATKALRVAENLERVLAIELFNASQALEFRRPLKSSPIIEKFVAEYRKVVEFVRIDKVMYTEIAKSVDFVKNYPLAFDDLKNE